MEECKEVPGVSCHLKLELVETPKCYPVPVEECDDILKEIPYLVEEEECNNVPKLVCNTVRSSTTLMNLSVILLAKLLRSETKNSVMMMINECRIMLILLMLTDHCVLYHVSIIAADHENITVLCPTSH